MITGRELGRHDIDLIWTIDRSEVIENLYFYDKGMLVLKPERYDIRGWPSGETEEYTSIFYDCFDRGGWFYGYFDDETLIGVVILENEFIGSKKDQLQLKFLHISQAYRGQGVGKKLFDLARQKAKENGAKRLYISATPSERTIDFYLRMGCALTQELDPNLFALEPDDIHLEYQL
jgi:predicted N-acetyltransferase YhbS